MQLLSFNNEWIYSVDKKRTRVKTSWKEINNLPDIVSEIQVGKLFQGEKAVESAMVSGVDRLPRHIIFPLGLTC